MNTNVRNPHPMRTAVDIGCVALLLLLGALTVIVPERIPDAASHGRMVLLVIAGFVTVSYATRLIRNSGVSAVLHAFATVALFGIIFNMMAPFQHVIVRGWMDAPLLAAEQRLLGFDLSIWMQQITHPWLTEWFMFAYMIYVPLLPVMALIAWHYRGVEGSHEYALNIVLSYSLCYLGFMLFPVASPLFYHPQLYTVPLDGGFFTWTSEILRTKGHYAGGSLPSPHCAAGTVILLTLYRSNRKWFYVAVPVILSLYVATVYGRFHYIEDGIAGIAVALFADRLAPHVAAAAARLWALPARALRPQSIMLTHEPFQGDVE